MRIEVISTPYSNEYHTHFSSSFGHGAGIWKGLQAQNNGHEYHVEFSLEIPVILGENARLIEAGRANIRMSPKGEVVLTLRVEDVELEDGVLWGRIGPDGLILCDVEENTSFPIGEYIEITVEPRNLHLYPV